MAKVLDAYWSDGQSKNETADDTLPIGADWSDGESIVLAAAQAVGAEYVSHLMMMGMG